MSQSTAVSVLVERYREVRSVLLAKRPMFEALLPEGYPVEELVTGALLSISKNKELLDCDPQTIGLSLARIAQLQLTPGVTAHLVKYGRRCEMNVDYRGYIELMEAAGNRDVRAEVVYEGDDFEFEFGTDPFLKHKPRKFAENEARRITYSYATVLKRGAARPMFVVLDREAIEARRRKSPAWYLDPKTKKRLTLEEVGAWYARKSAIRELQKWVPKNSRRLALVQEYDAIEKDDLERGPVKGERDPEAEAAARQVVAEMDPKLEAKGEPTGPVLGKKPDPKKVPVGEVSGVTYDPAEDEGEVDFDFSDDERS